MPVPNGVRIRLNGFADEYERWGLNLDPKCPTHLTTTPIPAPWIQPVPYGGETPAATVLSTVQEQLGPEAYIELGFDLVHALRCMECGRCEESVRPYGTLSVAEAVCPWCTPSSCRRCGASLAQAMTARPDLVFPDRVDCASCFEPNRLVLRDAQTINRIEPGSPVLDRPLSQLGVPMLDILEGKAFDAERSIFLQLDGDEPRVFGTRDPAKIEE